MELFRFTLTPPLHNIVEQWVIVVSGVLPVGNMTYGILNACVSVTSAKNRLSLEPVDKNIMG